jgi:hypothetical protein
VTNEKSDEDVGICEDCQNWTRLPARGGIESTSGECSEWSCDGRKPLLFWDEYCSRFIERPEKRQK